MPPPRQAGPPGDGAVPSPNSGLSNVRTISPSKRGCERPTPHHLGGEVELGHSVLAGRDGLRDLIVGHLVLPFGQGQVRGVDHRDPAGRRRARQAVAGRTLRLPGDLDQRDGGVGGGRGAAALAGGGGGVALRPSAARHCGRGRLLSTRAYRKGRDCSRRPERRAPRRE